MATQKMQTATTVTTTAPEMDLFEESIKSKFTLDTYKQALRQFTQATGFELNKESTDGRILQTRLIEYLVGSNLTSSQPQRV